jgi:hypothetical protein
MNTLKNDLVYLEFRPKKEEILDTKKGRTWVTPHGKSYQIDWDKVGNKYFIILIYKGHRMKLTESDWNKGDIDTFIKVMEEGLKVKGRYEK